jgi:phage I-like protein
MSSSRNQAKWPDAKKREQAAYAICNASIRGQETRGYVFDLGELQFEEEKPTWVHLLPYGQFEHPVFGPIDITAEKVTDMVTNFQQRVRGQMLDIDYAHKTDPAKGGKAAGWIIGLESRDDGLWGLVSWTGEAQKEVKDGAWKYMSAEYQDKWCNPQGSCWDNVLFGGALTNRPFMKDLAPINLMEYDLPEDVIEFRDFNAEQRKKAAKEGAAMPDGSFPIYNREDLVNALRLLSQASNKAGAKAHILKRARALGLMDVIKDSKAFEEEVNMEEFLKKLAELLKVEEANEEKILEALDKKLQEAPPPPPEDKEKKVEETKKFADLFPDEAKRMIDLELRNRGMETDKKLVEWSKGKSGKGVPVTLHEDIKKYRLGLGDPGEFDEVMQKLVDTGLVDFSEVGSTGDGSGGNEEPQDEFLKKVKQFQEEKKATLGEAVKAVAKAEPELAKAYHDARPEISSGAK